MKYKLFFLLLILISQLSFSQTTYFIKYKETVPKNEIEQKVISDQFISPNLSFQFGSKSNPVDYLAKGIAKNDEVLGRIIKIRFDKDVDEASIMALQNVDQSIEYIEKSKTYQMEFVPNDSLLNEQWALQKIQAFDAWDVTQGADSVLIGMIDTGIDYYHPDLKNKIYQNPGETGLDINGNDKRFNGIDDDNNGFIDDYRGWDFTDRVGFPFDTTQGDFLNWDNDPFDPIAGSYGFHGTFVAGIAGAEANNVTGIAGVAPNIKLLNLRSFDNGGSGEEDDAAAAILYAVQMGAKVISMSWGDYSFSYVLRDVIRYAYSKNVVLVGSAGNSNSPNPHYPSGYSEVICVGNSTPEDYRASNSNYGSTLDLMAPGTSILSTTIGGGYRSDGGTSAATPHVAATAALILSLQNFTNEEVKQILKTTSDDIGEPGWDIYTGAGRLNTYRAVTVIAPSIIKFNHPLQDFATLEDTLTINATVLSPLFSNYNLFYGYGLNPTNWLPLIENGLNQFSNEDIYNLNIASLPDTVYCLRLELQLTNGRTLEERVNFFVMRSPPNVVLIGDGPIYYGEKSTIQAEFYTSQPSITKLYYRKIGNPTFDYVTLDGFTTNNEFVKQFHYGFIPINIVQPSTVYEVYYEAENLAGLTTTVLDTTTNSYFIYSTYDLPETITSTELNYKLPKGYLFEKPVSFLSNNYNEVLFQTFYTTPEAIFGLYEVENDAFVKIDSIQGQIPRLFGDFNNNGKKDLFSVLYPSVLIDEQAQPNAFDLVRQSSARNIYYPIQIGDFDNDGNNELITEGLDNQAIIYWRLNPNLTSDSVLTIYKSDIGTTANLVITDTDGDLKKEIWILTTYGDLRGFEINGPSSITPIDSFKVPGFLVPQNNAFDVGDYNGDGNPDFCILYYTNSVAPNFLALVLSYQNGEFNILTSKVFLDQSSEYLGQFNEAYQSIGFIDVDNDGVNELIANIFPYSYIFKNDLIGGDKIVYFEEGVNTYSIFKGDLNQNNIPDIALWYSGGIKFIELSESNKPFPPNNFSGFSIDSTSINLSWQGSVDQYYIYRGLSSDNLILTDSVISQNNYVDYNLTNKTNYYYAVQAFDLLKEDPYSNLSKIIEVYCHTPGKVDTAFGSSRNAISVKFSEKMNNTIENLQAFKLNGTVYPNSISPASQFSYLVTFRDNIPVGQNQLLVSGLRDLYGSPIQSATITFYMDSIIVNPEFFISSFDIVDAYNLRIVFNLSVDDQSAENVANYSFEPENKVTSAKVDATNKRIVNINLKGQKPVGSIGREYVMRVQNLISSDSTGSIPINEGAGSYLVLSSFAKDLSDVYVYPNPVKPVSGEMLTFANLPQYAKITIWTINGSKIGELEESDGNGGATFNLIDINGNQLSSGIYIYRVVMLDESSNEKDEKIGKFAVIR
jgi:subtilisin family serine protease